MKIKLSPLFLLIAWIIPASLLSQSQCQCTMVLRKNKLVGECEDHLFTGLEIALENEYTEIDSTTLFEILPGGNGFLILKEEYKIDVEFVITTRSGFPQIMLKPVNAARVGWYTFDNLDIKTGEITFLIDKDPEVPFFKEDLEIISQVRNLLKDSLAWNKNDDRRCEDDIENRKYSFFCALQTASINVIGEYNHRNAVMQLMRHLIEEKYPNKVWEHRFKDFNNMPQTTFRDITRIIDQAEKTIKKDLQKKQ